MPIESQNIEFKESWRDEYQKWICGFANAQGGILYVGIKDNGEVCGVQDAKKLMEDIPNKVRDMMGILVEVNLREKDEKQYLEIVTEAYPYKAISGDCDRGLSLSHQFSRKVLPTERCDQSGTERGCTRPLHASQARQDMGWCACALSESGGFG